MFKVYVIKNNRFLGVLEEDSKKIQFIYADTITEKEYLKELNYPINTSTHLFPVFENMLPEHDRLVALKAQSSINSEIEALLYLHDIHGSFEFYTEDEFNKIIFQDLEPFNYNDVKTEVLDNKYTFPNILDYALDIEDAVLHPTQVSHSKVIGLSGYQYKFSVTKDDDKKLISLDGEKNSNYFMKPYSEYYTNFRPKEKDRSYIPYLLINEHIFMTLARDFGFNVPYNGIIKGKQDYHYIIKRFDRHNDEKIDHYEVLTLMGKLSDQKYKVTMREVFDTVKTYIDNDNLIELYKFIVFSVVIGHGDLHAKNLSLIYKSSDPKEEQMELSPFYDISTTKIYKDTKTNDVGLKIGNKTSKIKKEHLLDFAKIVDIDRDIAKSCIQEVGKMFIDTFENYIKLLPDEIKVLPYRVSSYGTIKPLENILKEYYVDRKIYIEKNLLDSTFIENPDAIWN